MTVATMTHASDSRVAAALAGGVGAGLVPSKTKCPRTLGGQISQHPEDVFARRFGRMRSSIWCAGQGHAEKFSGWYGARAWFVTLTYLPGVELSADLIRDAIHRCRKWRARQHGGKLRYVWVAELQKRGAVHYHLIVYLPKRLSMPKWDKQGWWPHGMTNTQVSRSGVGYLMKYVSKFSPFHAFPKWMRLYGIGGLNEQARAIRSWRNLPTWARDQFGVGELTRRACGLVVRATGEILESPWAVLRGAGGLWLYLVGDLPPRYADGPYSALDGRPCGA